MRKSNVSLPALACLLLVGAHGCATISSGTTQTISVSTNVDGANLYMESGLIGTTPFTGVVEKNQEQIRIELEGYQTQTLALSKSLDPIFWANIILGGTIGSIVDFASGAAYSYAPATYQVDLRRADQSQEDFLHEVAVRKFSMIYIDEIAIDVSNGGGDYLQALTELVRMRGSSATSNAVTRALIDSNAEPVAFGDAAVALR